MDGQPSLEEVLKYAKPQVMKFIAQYAMDLPFEQKEEIEQTAYIRLIQAYGGIDANAGWKSYVYNHCRGAVLDYLKFGVGFQEDKWSIAKTEDVDSKYVGKIRERVVIVDADDGELEIDYVLGANGVFSELVTDRIEIKWDLVARMASQDDKIHALAKYIRGISLEEMAPTFKLCRSRMGQLLYESINRFDDPSDATNPWFLQTCYAFGLCERLGMPNVDQSLGWSFNPVDLDEIKEPTGDNDRQLSFPDAG